jgi:hypothetical protein
LRKSAFFYEKNMRLSIITAVWLLATIGAEAQNCQNYLLLQNNKRVEMTVYNRKGKEDGKQVWQVSQLKKSGSTTTATVSSEFFDGKGKSINKATNEVQCTGNALKMNMKMMLSEAQLKQMKSATVNATGQYIDYPATLKEGDQLPDGNMTLNYTMDGGLNASVELSVTERKVGRKESVTSPAGNWDCFMITSVQKIVSKIGGMGIPIKMEVTEWYAPGVGVIKTQSKYGSTLITAIL